MAEFASAQAYEHFEQSVKKKSRFVHDEGVREFLQTVLDTSVSRKRVLATGQILHRAQRGFTLRTEHSGEVEFEVEGAHPPSRMIPNPDCVGDGRVNTTGIPCLYLASDSTTAMAEVRPWVGSRVSLAQFKVMRNCTVVDCSLDKERGTFMGVFEEPGELDAAKREAGVWGDIAYAFSKPVALDEPHLDYVPTQVLAEAFRSAGCDGIVYRSLLHEGGKNIALFDLSTAELINCGLYETKSVTFKFDQADNPYFIGRHYPEIAKSQASREGAGAATAGDATKKG